MRIDVRRAVTRAAHRRPVGGVATFLPGPLLRSFAAFAALVASLGCASAAKQVATMQNNYDFREARYEEACVVATPPSECVEAYAELHAFEKHLHEAAKALKNGGGMSLQLGAIKADDKALAKRAVAK